MHLASNRNQARLRAKRRSGAAMLIVMLVLLVVTAGATMAVYSSQFESRAAGHQRQAMQTAQIAQAGIAAVSAEIEMMGGARVLEYEMCSAPLVRNQRLSPEEPPMNPDTGGSDGITSRSRRYTSTEMIVGTGAAGVASVAVAPTDSVGVGMPSFEPRYIVDINDAYNVPATFVGNGAGSRVDGNGTVQLQFLVSTMTSRGRMTRTGVLNAAGGMTAAGVSTSAEAARSEDLRRDIFETSITSRAWTISGPYSPQPCRR